MKKRIVLFFSIFIFFIFIFAISKIAFVFIAQTGDNDISAVDIFDILYHGLPLDLSMSGYLTIIPALLLIVSIWFKPDFICKLYNVYFAIVLAIITTIVVVDIAIYPYWGVHFDSSVFLYLQNPKDAFASASALQIGLGILAIIIVSFVLYMLYIYCIRFQIKRLGIPKYKTIWRTIVVLVLLTGLLFLPIRGGVTVSTMNVGKVYYSDNMFFNHAAINPVFNLMYSYFKSEDFGSQYQFFEKEEATKIFGDLNSQSGNDSIPRLLNTDKPNIIFFILESFSANVAFDSVVAPNISRLAKDGVLFDHFFANSYRTDRGLVSILSGYPSQPTTAIMKYPNKTRSLPSIPKSLKDVGYNLSFYYGGDIDFANMRSFLIGTCRISDICSDSDFPITQRLTKWGVPDKYLLDRVYQDIIAKRVKEPFMKTVLTLSSHEPFDVPTHKFAEPFRNAIAYTDSCLGSFVEQLKRTKIWDNTLIVFVADHAMQSYPVGLESNDPQRFHVPLILIGGAAREPKVISDFGSQNDIAATLLSQLDVKHDNFKFSKDMLNPKAKKFAFYSYVNGFSMIDSTGYVVYDNDRKALLRQKGDPDIEKKAKAFFQNMYIDLGKR